MPRMITDCDMNATGCAGMRLWHATCPPHRALASWPFRQRTSLTDRSALPVCAQRGHECRKQAQMTIGDKRNRRWIIYMQ